MRERFNSAHPYNGSSVGLRGANRALILQQLQRFQPLSRADIARRSGLSEGTVSRLVAELISEHLVTERGAESSTGGRPGTRLLLDSTCLRAVGVEILSWETRITVGSIDARVPDVLSFRTPASPEETLHAVAARCEEMLSTLDPADVEGVGVSVRGVVNNETGIVEIGNTPAWNDAPVRAYLEERLGVPVYVENNVRAAAMAEYITSSTELAGNRCLLFVRVDEGIGVGIVLNGVLYRGSHMAAGESGEMIVADSGNGKANRSGTLESLSSNTAICERYAELTDSLRKTRAGDTSARVRTICHLAMQGDPAARQAIAECCRYLGIGIANLVWGLDPDTVIIDGAITDAWTLMQSAILEQLPDRTLPNFRNLIIRPGALGVDAALIGAVMLPFGPLFAKGERTAASRSQKRTETLA